MKSNALSLYTWTTPNGFKVSIALEELGLPYEVHAVDIGKGQQFTPEFVGLNPNSKIPVLVDSERGVVLSESVAILIYLAEKYGRFLSPGGAARFQAMQWLFFQAASVGPMMGQFNHFKNYAQVKLPYAIERYETESHRILKVLNRRLGDSQYLASDDYSIADIATWPWMRSFAKIAGETFASLPHLHRWYETIGSRPAVKKGLEVPKLNLQ